MLRNRYNRTDLFALVPQLDLRFDPQLEQLDRLLDDEILDRVRDDLARRYPRTRSRGRPSSPVEVILRMLVVMRLYGSSYAQAEYFVNDSLVLRQFCRVYLEKVPDDTTLIRWDDTIGPETIRALNDRVVQLARSLKVARGRKLRVDTTAVETDIHFPTDSGLGGDGVRVVSRLLRRAKAALGEAAGGLGEAFRGRVRTVRKLSQQLHRIARRKGDAGRAALKAAYGRLAATAKRTAAQGRRVRKALQERADEPGARRRAARLEEDLPRLNQGIGQAWRRMIQEEPVPAGEKLLSLFEPHSQVVPRFKAGQAVEFGRKIRLDEVEGGSSWMRSRGARHRIRGPGAGRRPGPAVPGRTRWPSIGGRSAGRRTCWPPTAVWRRRPTSGGRRSEGGGSGEGTGSGRGSRGESTRCGGIAV